MEDTVGIVLKCEKDLHEKLTDLARNTDTSLQKICIAILKKAIETPQDKRQARKQVISLAERIIKIAEG